jgi:hypothetical protein
MCLRGAELLHDLREREPPTVIHPVLLGHEERFLGHGERFLRALVRLQVPIPLLLPLVVVLEEISEGMQLDDGLSTCPITLSEDVAQVSVFL